MNGKGSTQRSRNTSDAEWVKNYNDIFLREEKETESKKEEEK